MTSWNATSGRSARFRLSGDAFIRYYRLVCRGSTSTLKCLRFAQVWAPAHGPATIGTQGDALWMSCNLCIFNVVANGPNLANLLVGVYCFSGKLTCKNVGSVSCSSSLSLVRRCIFRSNRIPRLWSSNLRRQARQPFRLAPVVGTNCHRALAARVLMIG